MVSPRGEWVYTIVEDLISNCFRTSTENLEQAMQVSGWGALLRMCTHTSTRTHVRIHACICAHTQERTKREIIFLCCPSLCNMSLCPLHSLQVHNYSGWGRLLCGGCVQVHNKDVIVRPRALPTPHTPGLLWGGHN